MRRIVFVLVAVGALAGVVAYMAPASGQADGEAAPIFGVKIPPGYRDWRLISVAHEEGNLNDLRAILGNDVAIKAYREGQLPYPDGTSCRSRQITTRWRKRKAFGAANPSGQAAKNGFSSWSGLEKYASTGFWVCSFQRHSPPARNFLQHQLLPARTASSRL